MQNYSVLMSVYYKETPQFLEEAIQSMLNQSAAPNDFVLVCDGPLTAELDGVILRFVTAQPELFNVIRLEKNVGLGRALKVGLEQCKNEFVARMDSDDISSSDRCEKQLSAFKESPWCSVIGGQIAEFAESTSNIIAYRSVPLKFEEIKSRLTSRNPMNHVTTMFRKSDIEAVGSYEDYPGFEDYQLWAKMMIFGKHLKNLNEVLCYVRVDKDMYRRRGGMQHFRYTKKLLRFLRQERIISSCRYLKNLIVRFGGTVIVSPALRERIYNTMLRKKSLTR